MAKQATFEVRVADLPEVKALLAALVEERDHLRASLKRVLDECPDGMLLDLCERFEMGSPGSHLALSFEPRAMALADDMDAMRRNLMGAADDDTDALTESHEP